MEESVQHVVMNAIQEVIFTTDQTFVDYEQELSNLSWLCKF